MLLLPLSFSVWLASTAGGVLRVACVDAVAGIPDVAVVPAATAGLSYLFTVVAHWLCLAFLFLLLLETLLLFASLLMRGGGGGVGSQFGQGDRHCGTYSRNICKL